MKYCCKTHHELSDCDNDGSSSGIMSYNRPQPLVSVIIPYHNEGELLKQAIASVESQTFDGQLEIIVVDDASEIAPLIPSVSRFPIKIVRSDTNLYAGGARNMGVMNSTGELLCFLDADDQYLPERVASQVHFLKAHPEVVMVGSPNIVRDEQERLYIPYAIEHYYPEIVKQEAVLPESYRRFVCLSFPYGTGSMTIRREAWNQVKGFDVSLRWGEEVDLQVRLAQLGQVGYVPERGYRYLCRQGSVCTTRNPRKQMSAARMFQTWRKICGHLTSNDRRTLASKAHRAWLLAAQIHLEDLHDARSAWYCAVRAATCGISVWGMRSLGRTTLHMSWRCVRSASLLIIGLWTRRVPVQSL